jgi:hypothetical protein
MLTDENQSVREQVHGHGKTTASGSHHELVFFEFLAVIVKDGHW